MKTLRLLSLLALLFASNLLAISPNSQSYSVTGSATTAGVVCSLFGQSAPGSISGFGVVLDASALATSTITVNINVKDDITGSFVTPAAIGNPSVNNPITVTNGISQFIEIPVGAPGVQVSVASFGTATGTFRAEIYAY